MFFKKSLIIPFLYFKRRFHWPFVFCLGPTISTASPGWNASLIVLPPQISSSESRTLSYAPAMSPSLGCGFCSGAVLETPLKCFLPNTLVRPWGVDESSRALGTLSSERKSLFPYIFIHQSWAPFRCFETPPIPLQGEQKLLLAGVINPADLFFDMCPPKL